MNYLQTVQWMFQQLPMYQNIGAKAYKKDLSNIINLASHLGNPEKQFRSVHVAGTNGKGSTCHMLASILQESGYKTGLYTSPHLKDFKERIKINGTEVSEDFVTDFISKNKAFIEHNQLSFFEMTVGMAYEYFYREKVDIAIIEVGLGGRLDSTNIITPEVSVITNIGLDHTAILGPTLKEISREKAGIIKKNVPVIIGESKTETKSVFLEKALELTSEIFFVEDFDYPNLDSDLKGIYQSQNIRSTLKTVEILRKQGWSILDEHIKLGLGNVVHNTGLHGRWEVIGLDPKIIVDTGHNKEGLMHVMGQLKEETFNKLHIVFGVVEDKDLTSILPLMPNKANYYFCAPKIPRALGSNSLQKIFANFGISGNSFSSVGEGFEAAKNASDPKDLIFIGGSTFVVAEVL